MHLQYIYICSVIIIIYIYIYIYMIITVNNINSYLWYYFVVWFIDYVPELFVSASMPNFDFFFFFIILSVMFHFEFVD